MQMNTTIKKRGLSEAETAQYLGVSRSTLRQARIGYLKGRLPTPPFVKVGRKVIYLLDDLDRWLESHRQPLGTNKQSDLFIERGRAVV
jgi:hypothetical protein